MRFVLHGNVDSSVEKALVRHGHSVVTLTEAKITANSPDQFIEQAHQAQVDVVTNDRELSQYARIQPVKFDRSLIYLLVEGEVEEDDAIDRLFARFKRLKPGQLYTITESQVKVQQMRGK